MCHCTNGLMGYPACRDKLVNLLAVVKAVDTPAHEVLTVVQERAVVRFPEAGVSPVDAFFSVIGPHPVVLNVVALALAKLSQ
ncbi:hypothetical protein D3C78_1748590 [compost metagenome]